MFRPTERNEVYTVFYNTLYGPFAIEKEKTDKKNFFELIVILNIFQPKNHIWHININFIFFGSFSPFYCKGPIYCIYKIKKIYAKSKIFFFQKVLKDYLFNC